MAKFKRSDQGGQWWFECPGCKEVHAINDSWTFNGDVDKPTVSPSILVNNNLANPESPKCHSFVRDGMIQFLDDCTHELAGQTVEIPDWSGSI